MTKGSPLDNPIYWPPRKGDNQTELSYREQLLGLTSKEDYYRDEVERRIPYLFDHFGINSDDSDKWRQLATALAMQHEKAFQLKTERPKPPGRNAKWNEATLFFLFMDVRDLLKSKKGKAYTTSWACEQLIKRSPWKEVVQGNKKQPPTGKTLHNAYLLAKTDSPLVAELLEKEKNGIPSPLLDAD